METAYMGTFDNYQRVYGMLQDEESRDIYLSRLNWLISGDYGHIHHIISAYLPGLTNNETKTMADLRNYLPKDRKVVLYGAGGIGSGLLPEWKDDERFIGFCSHTKEKQKNGYFGFPVMAPEELLSRKDLSVVISTVLAKDEILQILHDGGYPEDQIYTLSDCGQYFGPDFMSYEDEEVLIDAGSYNLGDSLELKKYCKKVKKVYAFEPNPDFYRTCLKQKEQYGYHEAEILPYGTWSECTTLHFQKSGGCSHISENGGLTIPVRSIDEVVDPKYRVTMIKMDVEGSELESLKGARSVIQRDKPKLAICIYHKAEDMVEIPLYIKALVPEYKLYIRHHSHTSLETVLYAVMPNERQGRGSNAI